MLHSQKHGVKVAFKLHESQIFIRDRQNVKTASQLFSRSNAKAIQYYGERKFIEYA